MIIVMKKKKQQAGDFISNHPEAAKVYITGVTKGTLTVFRTNDELPVAFLEGVKHGFLLLPGDNVIHVQYSWTRPGIAYKTVTNTVGPTNIQVNVEAYKSYSIDYDKKAEEYIFKEIN